MLYAVTPAQNARLTQGDFGYRKPDKRQFNNVLNQMGVQPAEVVFLGNDRYHDVHGAQRLGMKTVFSGSDQGLQQEDDAKPDYIIYCLPGLLKAIRFFEDSISTLPAR